MGTRGSIGFIKKGEEKITYNHWDSYPSELGMTMLEFCRDTDVEELNKVFDKVILVSEDEKPTTEQIEECRDFIDTDVSGGSPEQEWYVLLRGAQGNPSAYKGSLRYMLDGKSFLLDSLFCEYAYIINLDENVLEFYKGFNKEESGKGRYSSKRNSDEEYYGVTLEMTISLADIKTADLEALVEKMESSEVEEE